MSGPKVVKTGHPYVANEAPRNNLLRVQQIPVGKVRPEEGLARKRDRGGHQALTQSIAKFGVLTPITVRQATDDSGDFLLIKGQGRTLACRHLGIQFVPAIIVDNTFGESEKVQQFLVENVARLRMRPVDRALLIAHARHVGEETVSVAKRFGVSATTVRRLELQLKGATTSEVAALRSGDLNLALHAVIVQYVRPEERRDVIDAVAGYRVSSKEMEVLLTAIEWESLGTLGPKAHASKIALLQWICLTLTNLPRTDARERLVHLATKLPMSLASNQQISRSKQ